MLKYFAKAVLKLLGFKIEGQYPYEHKKLIFAVIPHTSNWDFPLGILVKWALKARINFIAKSSLFKWPFGWFFRILGGTPVERKSNENQVEAIARVFSEKEEFRLALAPEGTRKKVEEWRTGFYYLAKTAKVPIIMFTLDFINKQNHFSEPFYPSDNKEADFNFIKSFYKGVKGKIPEYS